MRADARIPLALKIAPVVAATVVFGTPIEILGRDVDSLLVMPIASPGLAEPKRNVLDQLLVAAINDRSSYKIRLFASLNG